MTRPRREYPKLPGLPNQPDDRLRALLFNGPLPATYAERTNLALFLAKSCLTCYIDPQGNPNSYLDHDDNGTYAREALDAINYLRLVAI